MMDKHGIPPKINITPEMIKGFKNIECKCGGMIFENGIILKKISALVSPSGREEIYPMEILVCKLCNKVPKELNIGDILPKEIMCE